MDGQKLGVLETAGVLFKEFPCTKRSTTFIPTRYSPMS